MKMFYLLSAIMLIMTEAITQNSFDFRLSNSFSETLPTLFEDYNGNYFILSARTYISGQKYHPIITRFTKPEDTVTFVFNDTVSHFRFGLQKDNGNYYFIGNWFYNLDSSGLYLWETNPEFETICKAYYDIPNPYTSLEVLDYDIDFENNLIIGGRAYYPTGNESGAHLYMAKADLNGQLLSFNIPAPYKRNTTSSLLVAPDTSGYYLIGSSTLNSILREWIKFDSNLNIIDEGLFDWDFGLSNTSALFLPNGNLLIETQWNQHESFGLFDPDFNLIKDTLLPDGNDYSPFQFNSTAFTDPENIWIASHNSDPYWMPGYNFYHVFIYDSQLNLKGLKYFGGDIRYYMFDMIATSDGGCLIAGVAADTVGNIFTDIIIRKLMPDDIITHAEETPDPYDRDVILYPIPCNDVLFIETIRMGLQVNLYSLSGKLMLSQGIHSSSKTVLDLGHFTSGFYFFTITENSQIIQSGKLIKQ
jgi:hypothetical protein